MTALEKDPFIVQYIKVDDIIDRIMSLGRGTLLAKFDVESAYRITPVHPNDLAEWVLKKSMTWAFSLIIWTISTPWVLLILRRANRT